MYFSTSTPIKENMDLNITRDKQRLRINYEIKSEQIATLYYKPTTT